ncbi:uncharacterized protein LOC143038433 [Oratosquilla oratoria]|uniref:uncharacterized protein LOC143038433 n=1 Tax=Oratosquilla oratoria TaxID=337810 RepID=UPI003F76F1B9
MAASCLYGIGDALLRDHGQGQLRLVQCGPRFLTDAETRYATITGNACRHLGRVQMQTISVWIPPLHADDGPHWEFQEALSADGELALYDQRIDPNIRCLLHPSEDAAPVASHPRARIAPHRLANRHTSCDGPASAVGDSMCFSIGY